MSYLFIFFSLHPTWSLFYALIRESSCSRQGQIPWNVFDVMSADSNCADVRIHSTFRPQSISLQTHALTN